MNISIFRGNDLTLPWADANVVIDVVRAFTVAHYAFLRGAEEIRLVPDVEAALAVREKQPEVLLAGEIGGLPIEGFDLDNSRRLIIVGLIVLGFAALFAPPAASLAPTCRGERLFRRRPTASRRRSTLSAPRPFSSAASPTPGRRRRTWRSVSGVPARGSTLSPPTRPGTRTSPVPSISVR